MIYDSASFTGDVRFKRQRFPTEITAHAV